ncbi:hypothetical protein M885DRAFT_469770 [Pelagophyceae sp. CCMP2097]|nr:hypothetical protein M885DRAFT_469770 [Pelagophyceae sp. CCMP2097]
MASLEPGCALSLALRLQGKALVVDLSAEKSAIEGCEVEDPHVVLFFSPKGYDPEALAKVEAFRLEWLEKHCPDGRCAFDVSKPFGKTLFAVEGQLADFVLAARTLDLANVEQRRPHVSLKAKEAKAAAGAAGTKADGPKAKPARPPKAAVAAVLLPPLVDIDANLLHERLIGDVAALRRGAKAAGVLQLIVPACNLTDAAQSVTLAKLPTAADEAQVFSTVGIHPQHVPKEAMDASAILEAAEKAVADLESLLEDHVRAIGECGLDYSDESFPKENQQAFFEAQVDLAIRRKLPLFLHERGATEDVLRVLDCRGFGPGVENPVAVVVHCFTSDLAALKAYVERGFSIGMTGFLIRQNVGQSPDDLKTGLAEGLVPLDKIMVETDAPYMGFKGCRKGHSVEPKGKFPNLPSALPLIVQAVADCLKLDAATVAASTTSNARRFFHLPNAPLN